MSIYLGLSLALFQSSPEDMFIDFRERGSGRERERERERQGDIDVKINTDQLLPAHVSIRD